MVTNFLNVLSLCYMEPRPHLTWPSNEPFPFQSINWDGLVSCWLVECLNCQSYVSEIRNSYDWISYSLKPNPLPLPFLMNCKFFKWKSRCLFIYQKIFIFLKKSIWNIHANEYQIAEKNLRILLVVWKWGYFRRHLWRARMDGWRKNGPDGFPPLLHNIFLKNGPDGFPRSFTTYFLLHLVALMWFRANKLSKPGSQFLSLKWWICHINIVTYWLILAEHLNPQCGFHNICYKKILTCYSTPPLVYVVFNNLLLNYLVRISRQRIAKCFHPTICSAERMGGYGKITTLRFLC